MPDKSEVLGLMNASEAVYLATAGEKGPRIRALVNLRRADRYPVPSKTAQSDDFTVYLATSMASDKVREIKDCPIVSVYYCEPRSFHGVTLSGTAEILDDPALKEALWSDDWRVYWPDGASDPDYVVLPIKPEEICGWWSGAQFRLDPA
jgi:general stress protein 26